MRADLWRNALIYLMLLVGGIALIALLLPSPKNEKEVELSQLIEQARQGRIERIIQEGESIVAIPKGEGPKLRASFSGSTWELYQLLKEEGVKIGRDGVDITFKEPKKFNWGGILSALLPILLIGFLLMLILGRAQGANLRAFDFARSRARLITTNRPNVTFADVAGVDEAKQELQEIVSFLKNPSKFHALGAKVPHGILLVGPPGTGKTLLAKAVAGEANVPFFSVSGSEFVEMFVGVGASRVRDLFEQAKRHAPCIIFIDEIDAVGRHRGAGLGGGHDEREQTLNQILVQMDGFDTATNIIVIAATNRPDILDPALLRPGRFDRQVVLDRPDIKGRLEILKVHTKGKPLEPDVDLEKIARETPGFVGADLANLINEAAILAARANKKAIGMKEIEEAIDRVIAGPEKKSKIISQREREIIAYHETGHAIVARSLPNADPVHKISIVARGIMGGYTRLLPKEDRFIWTRSQFLDSLAVLLGGRVAEEVVFNEISTGAENDLEQATKLARRMVMQYGMSEKLGPRTFGRRESLVFLGKEITEERNYSEQIAQEIDNEVHKIITKAYNTAKEIITKNYERVVYIAKRLLVQETIEGEELERLFTEPIPEAI